METVNSRGPRPRAAANECREYQVAACGSKLGTADRRRSLVCRESTRIPITAIYRDTVFIIHYLTYLRRRCAVCAVCVNKKP